MRGDPWSSPTDVTPAGFNVRTTVHEYGGGAFAVHRGTVVFSQPRRPAALSARARTGPPGADHARHRRDCIATPTGASPPTARRWIGVRERHEGAGEPAEVVNELVVRAARRLGAAAAIDRRGPRLLLRRPASRPTARSSRSWPGTCRGCRGTAASSSSVTSAERRFGVEPAPRGRCVTARNRSGQPDVEPGGGAALRQRSDGVVEPGAHPATASGGRSVRWRPSSGSRTGCSDRGRSRSWTTGGSPVWYERERRPDAGGARSGDG